MVVGIMNRLKILIVGNSMTPDDEALVYKSLEYFAEMLSPDLDSEQLEMLFDVLYNSIVFEDIVAKLEVHSLRDHADQFGYILVLGTPAWDKLGHTNFDINMVICHTLISQEWSDPRLRERVIEQLKGFIQSWINMETESQVVEIAETDTHEIEWIKQNSNQFKRHIQLIIQNGRSYAALFNNNVKDGGEDHHLVLQDATKRLREPMEKIVPIVVDEKSLRAREKTLKNFHRLGYTKVFLMDIDEFMTHITLMCKQLSSEAVHIIVGTV